MTVSTENGQTQQVAHDGFDATQKLAHDLVHQSIPDANPLEHDARTEMEFARLRREQIAANPSNFETVV